MYLQNSRVRKMWLDKYLKSPISEHPWTINMLKSSKHLQNLHESTFIKFFVTVMKTDFENASLSDM